MRIAVVAPVWFPVPPTGYGGIELVVSLLADGLVDAGHDVTLFASGGSRTKAALVSPMAEPPDPRELGNPWYDAYHALASYLQVDGFDIVHDHAGIVGPICGAMLQGNPPVVHTLHGPWTEQNRAALRARRPATCISSRSATRSAPTTSTSRTRAPCTTASTSPTYPYREDKERSPRLHRARQPRQGTEGSDHDRAARRAAAAHDPQARRAARARVLRARDRADARVRRRAVRERHARREGRAARPRRARWCSRSAGPSRSGS